LLPISAKLRGWICKAELMTPSSGIGWGYHDELSHDFYEAFPEDE
jgi:hypothetical protein